MPAQMCRFYQKGYCRYGNDCHFVHSDGADRADSYTRGYPRSPPSATARRQFTDYDRPPSPDERSNGFGGARGDASRYRWVAPSQSTSSGGRASPESLRVSTDSLADGRHVSVGRASPSPSSRASTSTHPVAEYVDSIVADMAEWEGSRQWIYSCYGFEKGLASVFDFPDISAEEMRLEAYVSKANGTFDQHVQKTITLGRQYRQMWHKFANLSRQDRDILVRPPLRFSADLVRERLAGVHTASSAKYKKFSFGLQEQPAAALTPVREATAGPSAFSFKSAFGQVALPFGGGDGGGAPPSATPAAAAAAAAARPPPPTRAPRPKTLPPGVAQAARLPPPPLHTPLGQLSLDDLNAYKAPAFVLGHVPTVPPPRELVNL